MATDKLRETMVNHAGWERGDNMVGERPVLCRCGAVLKPDYRTSEPTEEIAWTEHVCAALAGAASADTALEGLSCHKNLALCEFPEQPFNKNRRGKSIYCFACEQDGEA